MLNYAARWVYRRMFPQHLRNALSLALTEVETFRPPEVVELPPGRCVLVLAPHADDETLGCGGTLHKYRRAGARVHVVFLTDGALGSRGLRALADQGIDTAERQSALAECREREAALALSILQVGEYTFLRRFDGELLREPPAATAGRLRALILDVRPEIIFLPFLADRHPDHMAATRLLLAGLATLPSAATDSLRICGYEVWTPLYANLLVDISAVLAVKQRALRAYSSQLSESDYLEGITGLNRYRGLAARRQAEYCESFYLSTYVQYRGLYHRMRQW